MASDTGDTRKASHRTENVSRPTPAAASVQRPHEKLSSGSTRRAVLVTNCGSEKYEPNQPSPDGSTGTGVTVVVNVGDGVVLADTAMALTFAAMNRASVHTRAGGTSSSQTDALLQRSWHDASNADSR